MTDATDYNLSPCPFCGGTENLRMRSVGSLTPDMPSRPHQVICRGPDCEDVSGPVEYGQWAARKAWNKRSSRAALTQPADASNEGRG